MNCFLNEGVSATQYAAETLDPIAQCVYPPLVFSYTYLLTLLAAVRPTCALALTITFWYGLSIVRSFRSAKAR
jgi:hypothetical protein